MEEKQHIGQLFDRIAGTYDGLNHGLSLNIDRLWRRKTVALMQPSQHVLDVAIGTADLTIEMFRQHKAEQVTGIDLSDQMMAIGQKKISNLQSPISNVQFVHANAQHMPFDDASFDAVTCAFGCRNFNNLDEGLREMYRVLKPGGQVTILESCARVTIYILRACYPLSAESSAATKRHTPISISPLSPSVGAKPSSSTSTMPASLPNTSSPSPSASPQYILPLNV